MIGCRGRVQRASNVIPLRPFEISRQVDDVSTMRWLDAPFPWWPAAGIKQSMVVAASTVANLNTLGWRLATCTSPTSIWTTLKVQARNFR